MKNIITIQKSVLKFKNLRLSTDRVAIIVLLDTSFSANNSRVVVINTHLTFRGSPEDDSRRLRQICALSSGIEHFIEE